MKRLFLLLVTITVVSAFSFGQMVVRGPIVVSPDHTVVNDTTIDPACIRINMPVLLKDSLNEAYPRGVIRNGGILALRDSLVFYSGALTDGVIVPTDTSARGDLTGYDVKKVMVAKIVKQEQKGQWVSVSFPFNVRVADFFAANPKIVNGTNFVIMEYDSQHRADQGLVEASTGNWKYLTRADILYKGTGYRMKAGKTYPDSVFYFPAGIAQLPNVVTMLKYRSKTTNSERVKKLSGAAGEFHAGWNYIGGMAPCSFELSPERIKWKGEKRWTSNTVYYLDNENIWHEGSFQESEPPLVTSPFVGFFVHLTDPAPGSFVFDSLALSHRLTTHPGFRASGLQKDQLIRLSLVPGNGELKSDMRICLNDIYYERLDFGDDAPRIINNPHPYAIVWTVREGAPLGKVSFPHRESREIPISFSAPKAGQYTFSLADVHGALQSAKLIDKVAGTETELLSDTYPVSVSGPTRTDDRFLLIIKEKTTDIPAVGETGIYAYAADLRLTVKNLTAGDRIRVTDVAGRLVASGVAPGDTYSTSLPGKGVYVVSVAGSRNAVVKVLSR